MFLWGKKRAKISNAGLSGSKDKAWWQKNEMREDDVTHWWATKQLNKLTLILPGCEEAWFVCVDLYHQLFSSPTDLQSERHDKNKT